MIRGIDVSRYQGDINWKEVITDNVHFAYIRSSKGVDYEDPKFQRNWENAHAVGLPIGAYHFFTPTKDAQAQAKLFCQILKRDKFPTLPPVVDIEDIGDLSRDEYINSVKAFLRVCQGYLSRSPMLYTGLSFANEHKLGEAFGKWDLWLAEYRSEIVLPNGWRNWRFWQYSDKGQIKGIEGAVDLDYFQGSIDVLKAGIR